MCICLLFLQVELGEKLMPCFRSTNSKIPCNRINLERGAPQFTDISTAEVGTIQLEFRDLSRVSKNQKYEVLYSTKT